MILDDYNNYCFIEFDDYCKKMKIIILCMLFYSFHILQLFDVRCFGSLKAAYGKKIEKMIQMHFTHIIKDDFFFAFKQVFFVSMDEKNIQARF